MARNCWRWFDYNARCEDCEWRSYAKNALGNAAQHHDRTGHTVRTEVSGMVTYCSDEEDARLREAKGE